MLTFVNEDYLSSMTCKIGNKRLEVPALENDILLGVAQTYFLLLLGVSDYML